MTLILGVLILGATIFLSLCGIALITLGKMIDAFPDERPRKPSWSSPQPASEIMAISCVIIFVTGALMSIISAEKEITIIGGCVMVAACLFVATGVMFSAAVLNLMNKKTKNPMVVDP